MKGLDDYLSSQDAPFQLLLQMQEIGVLSSVDSLGLQMSYPSTQTGSYLRAFISNDKALLIQHEDATKTLKLNCSLLTETGKILFGLAASQPDLGYLRLVGKEIAKQDFHVQLCDWVPISGGRGNCTNGEAIEA